MPILLVRTRRHYFAIASCATTHWHIANLINLDTAKHASAPSTAEHLHLAGRQSNLYAFNKTTLNPRQPMNQ